MKTWQNMGTLDRLLRAVVGIVLLFVAILGSLSTLWTVITVVVAAVLVATAVAGFCPAYLPFGLRTGGPGSSGTPRPA
ncbi:MAG TPA: DUF2892 domain-containing protein [bacterium]|nr:DUF2892 domain-containing protein [bacterium]